MVSTNDVKPARTYSTQSRVVRAVERQAAPNGKLVRFVIAKGSDGRFFPVFVGRVKRAEQAGEEAPPRQRRASAQQEREQRGGRRGGGAAKKAAGRKTAAKKGAAKKAVRRKARNGDSIH